MKSAWITLVSVLLLVMILGCAVQSRHKTRFSMTDEEQQAIDELYNPPAPEEEVVIREPETFLRLYRNRPVIRVNGLLIPADGIQDLYEYYVSFREEDHDRLQLEACESWIDSYTVASQWPETVESTKSFLIGLREQARITENFVNLVIENTQEGGVDETGGVLPPITRGMMVPIFEMHAFTDPVGTVSGPFPTIFGWHLIEVLSRDEEDPEDPIVNARHLLRFHGDNPDNINLINRESLSIWRGHATVEFLVPEMAEIYPGVPIVSLEQLEEMEQSGERTE